MRWVVTVLTCVLFAAGAVAEEGKVLVNHLVRFSPDGDTVAFSRRRTVYTGSNEAGTFDMTGTVHWCRVENPQALKGAKILAERGLRGQGTTDMLEDLRFSPDSRHLAAVSRRTAFIINLERGTHWPLKIPGGSIASAAWVSADEMAYARITETPVKNAEPIRHLTIFRHRIARGVGEPTVVYSESGRRVAEQFFWSPSGKYVLMGTRPWGSTRLLDLTEKTSRAVGARDARLLSASWKADDSAVFCAIERVDPQQVRDIDWARRVGRDFLLVRPGQAEVLRWPFDYGRIGEDIRYRFAPQWTADGRYVVDTTGRASCSLIRTALPQRRRPFRAELVKHFKLDDETAPPVLQPLTAPGWLWTRGPDGKSYAVDYNGKHYVHLTDQWPWAASPDGKRLADVSDDGKVALRDLKLPRPEPEPEPAPRSAPAAETQPASGPGAE